ncbi:MBL fold metallo-hydrolase [Nocardioides bruguierae]|uniref:Rhodanese-like domain-containing protein n=1 Tax=Nocardioides bruguierae TaxID=2945102 RepID=A0A9X2IGL5_9ACTN|nr:rhodanese-like domain-containing protein [Nocardioides bruguierae]MCM0622148.1 rhodanese-like domain-containing protein [Nocardioides bruguierae]
MYFAQHYLDCLSQASYLVGDETSGQAVVVDPRRDVSEYVEDAKAHGLTIVGVINTHFHADFLAGHLEMAEATGAWIGYGDKAETDYEIRAFADGERVALGGPDGVTLQIMHTPGHTPESISVLVYEKGTDATPYGALTGDALFIGDVGRPDLLASFGVTARELGGMLYDSVQHKLMGLADEVRVFPAHGAGSACGKNLSTETQSTIGEQRRFNYACQPMDEQTFVDIVTAGQPSAPEYFGYDATLNRKNRATYDESAVSELTFAQVTEATAAGAVLLDTREQAEFAAGHLRGSVSVPLDGRFAETAGMLLTPHDEIVVVAPEGHESEAVTRLARIGFDGVVGYLTDVEDVLTEAEDVCVGHASRLTPAQLDEALADPGREVVLVDVRNTGETEAGGVEGAVNIPLAELRRRVDEVPRDKAVVVYCAGGWRSSVAASYLRSEGFADVSDILGGFNAIDTMAQA